MAVNYDFSSQIEVKTTITSILESRIRINDYMR